MEALIQPYTIWLPFFPSRYGCGCSVVYCFSSTMVQLKERISSLEKLMENAVKLTDAKVENAKNEANRRYQKKTKLLNPLPKN